MSWPKAATAAFTKICCPCSVTPGACSLKVFWTPEPHGGVLLVNLDIQLDFVRRNVINKSSAVQVFLFPASCCSSSLVSSVARQKPFRFTLPRSFPHIISSKKPRTTEVINSFAKFYSCLFRPFPSPTLNPPIPAFKSVDNTPDPSAWSPKNTSTSILQKYQNLRSEFLCFLQFSWVYNTRMHDVRTYSYTYMCSSFWGKLTRRLRQIPTCVFRRRSNPTSFQIPKQAPAKNRGWSDRPENRKSCLQPQKFHQNRIDSNSIFALRGWRINRNYQLNIRTRSHSRLI